jgi:hypothetical protein
MALSRVGVKIQAAADYSNRHADSQPAPFELHCEVSSFPEVVYARQHAAKSAVGQRLD